MLTYGHTKAASYLGYITQAIVNNLPPLLFLTFQREYAVTLGMLTVLVSMNFFVQLLVDLASIKFVDRIGYRAAAIIAHATAFAGLAGLGLFPRVFPSAYTGLVVAMVLGAIGGGLNEVIISPIIEALPGKRKAADMGLLHSFYSWGVVGLVALSTGYFALFGQGAWWVLPLLWSLIPLANLFLFMKVPLLPVVADEAQRTPLKSMFKKSTFLLLLVLMICAGASEQAMSQWASLFAEAGLQVSKQLGDLLGPCLFAVLMGATRVLYAVKLSRFRLESCLLVSAILCISCYLLTVFSANPILSLVGCGLTGMSVGVLWPATLSLGAKRFPGGGTAMFALLALAGDVGCSVGPGVVGAVSQWVVNGGVNGLSALFGGNLTETSIKTGLLCAILFPVLLGLGAALLRACKKPNGEKTSI